MLFGETVAVYSENHTEHTDILYGRNAQLFFNAEAGGNLQHPLCFKVGVFRDMENGSGEPKKWTLKLMR
jgi:hypothetical protein